MVFEEEHDGGGEEDHCVGIQRRRRQTWRLLIETACASDVTLARATNDFVERFVVSDIVVVTEWMECMAHRRRK